jgi:YD repeat-containing protein
VRQKNGLFDQVKVSRNAYDADLATAVNASLTYDAQGRLRQTQITTGSTTKLSNLVAEFDTTTNALQRRYVHGPGVDEPLVWY